MEPNYQQLPIQAKHCMRTSAVISGLIIVLVLIGLRFVLARFLPPGWLTAFHLLLTILFALVLFDIFLAPSIRYARYRYWMDEEKIDVQEGLFFIKRQIVPLERIHKISMHKGPLLRFYGLANVMVTTGGGDTEIKLLAEETANQMAEILQKKINALVKEQRNHD